MKTLIITTSIFFAGAAFAASVDSPPPLDPSAPEVKSRITEKVTPASQLSQEEIARIKQKAQENKKSAEKQAAKDLEKAGKRSKDPAFWPKTKIEETVDNRGQVTEVTVTPMSTQIPYKMTREQPNSAASSDSPAGKGNTLSVPKFINFGF